MAQAQQTRSQGGYIGYIFYVVKEKNNNVP